MFILLLRPLPTCVARWSAGLPFYLPGGKAKHRRLHAYRWAATVVLCSGGLLSQTPANGQARSLTVSAEAAQGRYQDDVTRETYSTAILCTFCGSGSTVKRLGYYYGYALAGGIVALNLRPKAAPGLQIIGLGLRGGTQQVGFRPLAPAAPFEAEAPLTSRRLQLFDINPYLEGRTNWWSIDLGYRAGLHLGRLRNEASVMADSSLLTTWLAPDTHLWVGRRRVLFAQFDSGVGMLALGNYTSRFGLGTGLGIDDGRYLLAGMAVARHESGYTLGFLAANIPLFKSGLTAEPYAATNFAHHHQLHFRLSYQLPITRQLPPETE